MTTHDPRLWEHRLDYLKSSIQRTLDEGLHEGTLRSLLISGLAVLPDTSNPFTWEDIHETLRSCGVQTRAGECR